MIEQLNRHLNTFDRHSTLDTTPPDPFHHFSHFDLTHQGVTGVIYGANLTEYGHFWPINLFRPALITDKTLFSDYVH